MLRNATKVAAPQIPTARGRSCSLNRTANADSDITMIPAPASPSSTRAAMNAPLDGETAHAADPTANSARELSSTFLRP
jgi:hypothetical protein